MSSPAADDRETAAYPPEAFLEPWTLRRLRRVAWGIDDLGPVLAQLRGRRRVEAGVDPVVAGYLAYRGSDWAADTVDCAPHLAFDDVRAMCDAALHTGYLFGRLVVGTADEPQAWSVPADRDELAEWLDRTVEEIDLSGCWDLIGADRGGLQAIRGVLDTVLIGVGLEGDEEATGRCWVLCEEGLCLALVEHSTSRPVAEHVMVDLTAVSELLPDQVLERAWIAEALGCLLARLDERGRCSEMELRDAADELGGERGHRYFRQFRDWGLVDFTLTRRLTGTVRVPRHHELRSGPPAR